MVAHPERKITGFHQDEYGVWVAELEYGHQRHVRHDPPWLNHEWVTAAEGRQRWIGRKMVCASCGDSRTGEGR